MLSENFDTLYQKFFARILRHCQHIVRSYQDAEDLCQDAFVKAFSHLKKSDIQIGNLNNWLLKIATNTCLDFLKSARQQRKIQFQSLDATLTTQNDLIDPEVESTHQQLLKFLEECMSELLPEERSAISLKYLEKCTLQEIAWIMGKNSPNTARKRLKSGERKLKLCLEKKGIDDTY